MRAHRLKARAIALALAEEHRAALLRRAGIAAGLILALTLCASLV